MNRWMDGEEVLDAYRGSNPFAHSLILPIHPKKGTRTILKSNSIASCFCSSRHMLERSNFKSVRSKMTQALRMFSRSERITASACGYCSFTATRSPAFLLASVLFIRR